MIFKTCARFDCYVNFLFPDQHTVFILFLNKLAACALYLLLDVSPFAPKPWHLYPDIYRPPQVSCWQPAAHSSQVLDGVLSAAGYILKRNRYEKDIEKVRDVTGTWIVGVENERQFEREGYLEEQQEQRVQRDDEKASRARWSCVQSSEEGCFVSSYRLRVICLPQLCHTAVTHCYAPLCPGILAHSSFCPLLSGSVCVYSIFVSFSVCRLLA